MRKFKAADLVLDFDLYPRNNVDSHGVNKIADALEAGVEMPPVVIDEKSHRVIDGFHRIRAHLRIFGKDVEINCIEKSYKSDGEMFLDAMRYNSTHGNPLDSSDRVRCAQISERLSLPLDAVAGALQMSPKKLGALTADRSAKGAGNLSVSLRNTVRHFAGRRLSERQVEANAKLSGMNQSFYANQLIELIESGMLNTSDEKLMERLRLLHDHLSKILMQEKVA